MPRFEYRDLRPIPAAEKAFLDWIQKLDKKFSNRDVEHRSKVVREALHELYLGRPMRSPVPTRLWRSRLWSTALIRGMPHWSRNTTAMWTRRNMPSANL